MAKFKVENSPYIISIQTREANRPQCSAAKYERKIPSLAKAKMYAGTYLRVHTAINSSGPNNFMFEARGENIN